ncbi:MAG: ribonuclease III [Oscillospiraceae bacterium]|nr:ribonuclease III [Oscillospiraceae bacterium]
MREKLTHHKANQYSPLSLAFLGDSVYDTLVRESLLKMANMPVSKLHSLKIEMVCAEFQSKVYDAIISELSENEITILKRGRNATGNTVPKHSNVVDYRKATALECLFGYLYLTGENGRIYELFNYILINLSENIFDRSE